MKHFRFLYFLWKMKGISINEGSKLYFPTITLSFKPLLIYFRPIGQFRLVIKKDIIYLSYLNKKIFMFKILKKPVLRGLK